MPHSTASSGARPSWSLLFAALLATVGVVRLFSDFLTDIDPTWVTVLGDSPLRLLARISDGSFAGDLNVQYFKVMAIPCGMALVFLVNGGLTDGIAAAERRWASPRFRLTCIVALAAVCALCEIEKASHLLGLPTGLVRGERAWLNHVVHTAGGILAYPLSSLLRYRTGNESLEGAGPLASRAPRPPNPSRRAAVGPRR
jgi:hypothetical protein